MTRSNSIVTRPTTADHRRRDEFPRVSREESLTVQLHRTSDLPSLGFMANCVQSCGIFSDCSGDERL
jgi:hypothetical protein